MLSLAYRVKLRLEVGCQRRGGMRIKSEGSWGMTSGGSDQLIQQLSLSKATNFRTTMSTTDAKPSGLLGVPSKADDSPNSFVSGAVAAPHQSH